MTNDWDSQFMPGFYKSYFVIPTQVNYVTESLFVPGYTHPDSAKLQVLSKILSLGNLHKFIREKGGAYGGGLRMNATKASMSFFSYRDPNTLKTLENFEKSVAMLLQDGVR